jgi:uncharacterized protein
VLAGVGLLDLLPTLYSEIWIPEVVHAEYQAGQFTHPGSPDIDALPWLTVRPATTDPAVSPGLGTGEAAALALARASQARLVLLDERRARREAARLGLPVAGSLSVLVAAKQRGLLPAVAPVVDQMIAQGRRIGNNLRAKILALAGEAT